MSFESLLMVSLMSFVLLAPTLMVAVLVSGVPRRSSPVERGVDALESPGR